MNQKALDHYLMTEPSWRLEEEEREEITYTCPECGHDIYDHPTKSFEDADGNDYESQVCPV